MGRGERAVGVGERSGESVVAAVAFGGLAALGLATGDFPRAVEGLRRGLAIAGASVSWALALVVVGSWLAVTVCAALLVRGKLRVPSLLVVCAALAAPIGATLASLTVTPAGHARVAAAASFEEGVAMRAEAVTAVAAVAAVALWGAALGLSIATAGFARSTSAMRARWRAARRRTPRRPSGIARLAIGAGGLALAAVATWLGPASAERARLVLVPAALALWAVHAGRDARRTADIAAGLCAAAAIVVALLAALLTNATGLPHGAPLGAIARGAVLQENQRAVAMVGAFFLIPAVGTAWLAALHKPRVARQQASRIVGSGLLLAAISAAAAAVVMPDRWHDLSTAWVRHLPAGFEASELTAPVDSCTDLAPSEVVFVSEEIRWRGETLGPAARLDDDEGCHALARALPAAPTIAVATAVPAARISCLVEALAARTCTVRWLAHRAGIDVATPVCMTTTLAGRGCPTPPGPLALIDAAGVFVLSEGGRRRLAHDEVAVAPSALAACGDVSWTTVLAVAQRLDRARATDSTSPVCLAVAEAPAPAPPSAELVLPFRSVVELRLTPPSPKLEAALAPLSDRLRRCHQSAANWPPATVEGVYRLLPGSPPRVWRTDREPRAGASACVARAVASLPATGEPVELAVSIRTLLPRIELRLAAQAEPLAEAAFRELSEAIDEERADLDRCFRADLMANPTLAGSFTLVLGQDDRGYVELQVGEGAPPELTGCLANVLQEIRYPALAPEALSLVVELVLPE